jgi:membrane associated rhomboid family serine protease
VRNRATLALVALNVLAYLWETTTGGLASNQSLYDHGALCKLCVTQDGQWWRIYTSAFLHGGLAHIALNMFALVQIGTFVESFLGPWRMLAIYAVAMTGGGLGVVYFGAPLDVTVGASGAIFGLFGAVIAIGLRMGARGKSLISQMLPVVALNLAFTFAVPFISKEEHIGGLVSGFFAGLVFFFARQATQPVVVDRETGEAAQAEYLAPGEPNAPSQV